MTQTLLRLAVAAISLLTVVASPTVGPIARTHMLHKNPSIGVQMHRVKPFAPAAPLRVVDNSISLSRKSKGHAASSALKNLVADVPVPVDIIESGAAYTVDIDFGGERYSVIFDTGSSDLWLPSQQVQCFDAYGRPVPIAVCEFGPTFNGTLSGGLISNLNFNISYGDGEFLTGQLGFEDVCLGGIQVVRQQVALVENAYWLGDGATSGLIGFAYPSLTSAFRGNDPSQDVVNTTNVYYNNWIFSAIERGLVEPMFSLALERYGDGSESGGHLALGGLPDVETTGEYATAPLEVLAITPRAIESSNYTYYTIIPDGFLIGNTTVPTDIPVIVDSGTTLMYLPYTLTRQIALAFKPAAMYQPLVGLYEVNCNATVPDLAVNIGGTSFHVAKEDLLMTGELGYDRSTGLCLMGVQPIQDIYILGDTFLKNVVAVFDIGASEMRFGARA